MHYKLNSRLFGLPYITSCIESHARLSSLTYKSLATVVNMHSQGYPQSDQTPAVFQFAAFLHVYGRARINATVTREILCTVPTSVGDQKSQISVLIACKVLDSLCAPSQL